MVAPRLPDPVATVGALYRLLSQPAGGSMDSIAFAALFVPAARLQVARRTQEGRPELRSWSPDSFRIVVNGRIKARGYVERELWHRVARLGHTATVLSAYEAWFPDSASTSRRRGLNSVQLHFDGAHWRIVSLLWDIERSGDSLPPSPAPSP